MGLMPLLYVMLCYVMSCHVMSCHVMSCHVMSCHVMSCHVMSCHVMSCHVMSCHMLLCCVAKYPIAIAYGKLLLKKLTGNQGMLSIPAPINFHVFVSARKGRHRELFFPSLFSHFCMKKEYRAQRKNEVSNK